jgi:hypothetical protein
MPLLREVTDVAHDRVVTFPLGFVTPLVIVDTIHVSNLIQGVNAAGYRQIGHHIFTET